MSLTEIEFQEAVGAGASSRSKRAFGAARVIVDEYAPTAPSEVSNEACIRLGAYMLESGSGTIRSESVGPMTVEYVTNHAAMARNSGALALLTRWKRRRAGVIG